TDPLDGDGGSQRLRCVCVEAEERKFRQRQEPVLQADEREDSQERSSPDSSGQLVGGGGERQHSRKSRQPRLINCSKLLRHVPAVQLNLPESGNRGELPRPKPLPLVRAVFHAQVIQNQSTLLPPAISRKAFYTAERMAGEAVEEDEVPSIVLDSGSSRLRAGFAGDDSPCLTMPAVIGRRGSPHQRPEVLVGDDALSTGPVPQLGLTQPVQRGVLVDFDDAELLWRHAIEAGLRADPEQHPLLLAEPPLNPKCSREAAVQLLFESLGAPAVYLANASSLAMYASGPRQRGHALRRRMACSTRRVDCAGGDVTDAVRDVLRRRGCCLRRRWSASWPPTSKSGSSGRRAADFDSPDGGDDAVEEFELPDGRGLVGLSRRDRAEPWELLLGRSNPARLQRLVAEALSSADIDTRADLWRNVIVSGGSTMADGFVERLTAELTELAPPGRHPVKLVAPAERDFATWIGGSILASLSTFQERWVSRRQYEEFGPRVMPWPTIRQLLWNCSDGLASAGQSALTCACFRADVAPSRSLASALDTAPDPAGFRCLGGGGNSTGWRADCASVSNSGVPGRFHCLCACGSGGGSYSTCADLCNGIGSCSAAAATGAGSQLCQLYRRRPSASPDRWLWPSPAFPPGRLMRRRQRREAAGVGAAGTSAASGPDERRPLEEVAEAEGLEAQADSSV
uniref:Actin-related protein 8 n=1 Tax=Macrostomum lignano TaxID=282301 RepID=A0A1I8FF41_9PLAT